MLAGERQVAPSLDGIRRDHVARYEWAARVLPQRSRVVDLACGIGYGTQILVDAGHNATGYDRDAEAIAYAREHYGRAEFRTADGMCPLKVFDAAVCFETIEHIEDPRPLLESLRGAPLLLASVPNEAVFPWRGHAFHYRHYTKAEFRELLRETGWEVKEWWGQAGPESEVEKDVQGRTIIAVAERADVPVASEKPTKPEAPRHVCIVGLGPSSRMYEDLTKRLGGRKAFCDETWVINALGDVYIADRVFHMDDVRVQEVRAAAAPDSNIAKMLRWMKTHPGPIITSRAHPDYPGLVEFPLEDVLNDLGTAYFNSTAAYAVAYAVWLGVKKITCMGMDFTYPNAHDAEKGRGCVEFWLGVATARGIELSIPKVSTLMDGCTSMQEKFYGYDTLDIELVRRQDGTVKVETTPVAELPTAEEMEERYDHSAHPNSLVEASER